MTVGAKWAVGLLTALLGVFAPLAAGAQMITLDARQSGQMSFDLPKDWTRVGQGPSAKIEPVKPLGKNIFVTFEVFPDWDFIRGGFADLFLNTYYPASRGRLVIEGTPMESFSVPGCSEALLATAVVSDGKTGVTCIVMALYKIGDRYSRVYYQGNDAGVFKTHRPAVVALCKSVRFSGGKGGPAKPETAKPGDTKPGQAQPNIVAVPVEAPLPDRLPTELRMPAGSPDDAARELAKLVLGDSKESLAALVTAARASGFTIRDGRGVTWYRPLYGKGIGLAIPDSELRIFHTLMKRGHGLPFEGFCDAYGFLFEKLGVKASLKTALGGALRKASDAADPAQRFFARFIVEMGRQANPPFDLTQQASAGSATLNPVQFLFLARSVSESLRVAVKRAYGRPSPPDSDDSPRGPSLFAAVGDVADPPQEVPGLIEDMAVFSQNSVTTTVLEMMSTLLEDAGRLNAAERLEHYGKGVSIVNAAASLIKFVATYVAIESTFSLDRPAPLVRNKLVREGAGQKRRLTIKLFSNPGKIMDFMKQNRLNFGISGLDLDMPAAGPFKECKITWRMPLGAGMDNVLNNVLKRPVRFVGTNLVTTETDKEGRASIDIEGVPQKRNVPASALPVMKSVTVEVLLQVKKPEAGQDIWDAFVSALGIYGARKGGLDLTAVLTPVYEMIYRTRWLAPQRYNLSVRDWGTGGWEGMYAVKIYGSETLTLSNGKRRWVIDRSLSKDKFVLEPTTVPAKLVNTTDSFMAFHLDQPHVPVAAIRDTIWDVLKESACDLNQKEPITVETMSIVEGPAPGYAGAGDTTVHEVGFVINDTKKVYSFVLPSDSGYLIGANVAVMEKTTRKVGGITTEKSKGPLLKSFFYGLDQAAKDAAPLGLITDQPLPAEPTDGSPWVIEGRQLFGRTATGLGAVKVTYEWRFESVAEQESEAQTIARAARFAKWQADREGLLVQAGPKVIDRPSVVRSP